MEQQPFGNQRRDMNFATSREQAFESAKRRANLEHRKFAIFCLGESYRVQPEDMTPPPGDWVHLATVEEDQRGSDR